MQRGQTLIIFALSLTVLLGLAGLAIDVTRAYDLYARMERAAEAGALAGVLYMPTYLSSPTPPPGDGKSAVSRVLEETIKNGFGSPIAPGNPDCPATVTSVEVAVCAVTGRADDLRVTITEHLSVVLLGGLGVAPIMLSAYGQAEYLPPVRMGSRLNYIGDQVECSASNPPDPTNATSCNKGDAGNHLQYFMVTLKGPAVQKENGDPMVYCEEGSSDPGSAADLDGSSSTIPMYNGNTTNHVQWSTNPAVIQQHCGEPVLGGNPGNPDEQPAGYAGEATKSSTTHPGGYNFGIAVPQGDTTASLWIFNPTFVNGNGYDFFDTATNMYDPFGNGIAQIVNSHYDAPPLYMTMTYSLYTVHNQYDRTTDTLVTGFPLAYPPLDADSGDASLHSCLSPTSAYYPLWNGNNTANSYYGTITAGRGCVNPTGSTGVVNGGPAPCSAMWCEIATNLQPGAYRFVAEATGLSVNVPGVYTSTATDGWGSHDFALKVCAFSTIATPVACDDGHISTPPGNSIFAWNNMDLDFTETLTTPTPDPNNPATSCVAPPPATAPNTNYTCLDLGCIPSQYAGRKIAVRLFDPGDGGGGDLYIGVVPPFGSGGTVQYPPWYPSSVLTTIDGDTVVHARFGTQNYNEFNGLWVDAMISLPPNYTGNCQTGASGTGWWQLIYTGGANPNDHVGVEFTLVGSPVHLVPPF